jgi:hypothetical protein
MLNRRQARSEHKFNATLLYHLLDSPETLVSAQSTSTGGPFFLTTLKSITSPEQHAAFLAFLDSYLASETLTPLERAQFEIQRQWMASSDTVADVEVVFANLPGAAGLPLPDGQMTIWLPGAHLVFLPEPTVCPADMNGHSILLAEAPWYSNMCQVVARLLTLFVAYHQSRSPCESSY